MENKDNAMHKSYRDHWKSWFDKEASFSFEDGVWWVDFGHNGEPLVQVIQAIIDAHTVMFGESAPAISFDGVAVYVPGEESDMEITCSESVGYTLYDRSTLGKLTPGKTYRVTVEEVNDGK